MFTVNQVEQRYNTSTDDMVCFTSTWRPPTQKECIDEIIYYGIKLANIKWWQDGSYYRNRIKYYQQFLKPKN